MTEEEKFRSEVLVALARIETNQITHTATDKEHDKRLTGLEHTVNGNGSIGIAEKVRNLEANWKAITVGISVVVTVLVEVIRTKFGGK